jgi:Predicted glycosyltransferases
MKTLIDVVICSYRRQDLLIKCLNSLVKQHVDDTILWGIVIINNAPEALSEEVISLCKTMSRVTIDTESTPGLSHARNKAVSLSSAAWIAFLDDDGTVPINYIQKIASIIQSHDFACFGGHINATWPYGRPRWLDAKFGTKSYLRSDVGIITEGYNWGSNIIINKSALIQVGGFPTDIGMKGSHIGYAAENIVQQKLRRQNYQIGYDPHLYIGHAVLPHKLKIGWHLKAAYATGRDGLKIFPDQYTFMGIVVSLKNCFSRPPKAILKWLTTYNYYSEQVILDALKPYCLLAGKLRSKFF